MIGPDIAFWQQVGNEDRSDTVAIANNDLERREVVKKHLTTPTTRRNNPALPIPHRDNRVQLVHTLGSRRPNENQLGTGPTSEVISVHRRDDPTIPSTPRSRHSVVVTPTPNTSDLRRSLNKLVVNVMRLHGHLPAFTWRHYA